jgi:hypothetical protein
MLTWKFKELNPGSTNRLDGLRRCDSVFAREETMSGDGGSGRRGAREREWRLGASAAVEALPRGMRP